MPTFQPPTSAAHPIIDPNGPDGAPLLAGKEYDDTLPRDPYVAETKRLLEVLNMRLADRPWIMGDT